MLLGGLYTWVPFQKKCAPLGMGRRLQIGFKKTSPRLEWAGPTFWCPFQCHMDCHVGQMNAWVESLYKVLRPNLRNLCYAIGQFCQFFGTGRRCEAALRKELTYNGKLQGYRDRCCQASSSVGGGSVLKFLFLALLPSFPCARVRVRNHKSRS